MICKCQCQCQCGIAIEYDSSTEGTINVGEAQKKTGWTWIPVADGGHIWLCVSCTNRATPLVEELFKILGTTYAHIPSLLKTLPDER